MVARFLQRVGYVSESIRYLAFYKFMPENPQACLWDERHPLRAGVFRGRQPSNGRARQSFRTECGLLIKKPPSLLGGNSLFKNYLQLFPWCTSYYKTSMNQVKLLLSDGNDHRNFA